MSSSNVVTRLTDASRNVAFEGRPRVRWTDATGSHSQIIEEILVAGSAPGVGLRIADETVSRLHLELDPRDDGLWVTDLGSRNGTFIDNVRVHCARLPEGATLCLGDARLVLDGPTERVAIDLWPDDHFFGLIGRSEPMRAMFSRVNKVAKTAAPVLLQGETGTGKELIASAIHKASERASAPFVIVDCGALPENLLEAELFGHARGAFTGAVGSRAGAFEVGNGGTVFLDEIGELPLSMQPRLLRVLESQTIRRLGETDHRAINVRFVSATNRDLRELVNRGAFREDLYFRLSVMPLHVPPLRARREDIEPLATHFLANRMPGALTPTLLQTLLEKSWVGNVRELRNFIEQLVILGASEALSNLPGTDGKHSAPDAALPPVPLDVPFKDLRDRWLNHLEREFVGALLKQHRGNVTAVAEQAGLDRSYVHRLIKKHDLAGE